MKTLGLILALIWAVSASAQPSVRNASAGVFNRTNAPAGGGGGGGGGWAVIGSGVIAGSTDGDAVTTGTYDTSGATLIVIIESSFNSQFTPTDSKGNTWTKAVGSTSFTGEQSSIWYCVPTSAGAGHTFSVSSANSFAALAVYAFTGGSGGVLDKTSGAFNNGSATTVQPGSITPTTANQLIISGVSYTVGSTASVDSGFSTPLNAGVVSFQHEGGAAAFLVQGAAAAVNPTWTTSSGDDTSTIASFK